MKRTFLTLEQVKEIEKEYPTPFYIYDEAGIRKNVRRLEQAFPGTRVLRNISR